MLNITKEEFIKIYHDTPVLDYVDLFYSDPISDQQLLMEYMPSKLWRLNNLYTIVNKFGKRVTFRMNRSQHKVYAASLRHSRIIILKSRQQGISTLWLVSYFDDSLFNEDFSIGLMAQGTDEASTLLERTKILWEELPASVKTHFGLSIKKDNTKEFGLSNGSTIFIRTSFRSATLQRLHVSEMGKIANKYPEKASETKTGTLQAIAPGNTAVVESTAEGDNLFKDMWDNAVKYQEYITAKDFFPVFLSWIDDPDCVLSRDQFVTEKHEEYFLKIEDELGVVLTRQQKNFWIAQYRELADKIYQEYPSTPTEAFMATKDGAYYARLYLEWVKKLSRERPNLYDPNLDVQVSVDLGMNDTNVLTVGQNYMDEFRLIGEYADNGKEIKYYCDWMARQSWYDNLTHLILPHDAEVRELTSGLTRYERFEQLLPKRVKITLLPKIDRLDGIDMVRDMIPKMYIDPEKCPYLIECFYNYRKEWDEKRERWRDTPEHDEYSNGADSIRYYAVGSYRATKVRTPKGMVGAIEPIRKSANPSGMDI